MSLRFGKSGVLPVHFQLHLSRDRQGGGGTPRCVESRRTYQQIKHQMHRLMPDFGGRPAGGKERARKTGRDGEINTPQRTSGVPIGGVRGVAGVGGSRDRGGGWLLSASLADTLRPENRLGRCDGRRPGGFLGSACEVRDSRRYRRDPGRAHESEPITVAEAPGRGVGLK